MTINAKTKNINIFIKYTSVRVVRNKDGNITSTELSGLVSGHELAGKLINHTSTNVRDPNLDTDVARKLVSEFYSNPNFYLNNNGISIVVNNFRRKASKAKVKYDKDGDTVDANVSLNFGPDGGLINGGHTYAAICAAYSNMLNKSDLDGDMSYFNLVPIKITSKVDPGLIPEMIEGQNTAIQVKPFDFENLRGAWKVIEAKSKYSGTIRFKDHQRIDGSDVVRPIKLETVLKIFMHSAPNAERMHRHREISKFFKNNDRILDQFIDIMDDVMRMYDLIHIKFENNKAYKAALKAKLKNGTARGHEDGKVSLFIGCSYKYTATVPPQMIFCVMDALSSIILLDSNTGKFAFSQYFDEKEFFDSDTMDSILQVIADEAKMNPNQPSKLVRNNILISLISEKVRGWISSREIETLREKDRIQKMGSVK